MKITHPLIWTLVLLLPVLSFSQPLPNDRMTDWSTAGISEIPAHYDTVIVTDYGIVADGSTPNNALQQLLDNHTQSPTVFYFPEGTYFFNSTIYLHPSQVLKGEASNRTTFVFDLQSEDHLIVIDSPGPSGNSIPLTADAPKEALQLHITDPAGLQPGDHFLTVAEDADLVTSPWAVHSTGQIIRVAQVEGATLHFLTPLRKALLLQKQAGIQKLDPIQYAGVECLNIERKDSTQTQTSNIYFRFAANCWVKGVRSSFSNFAHVDIENSSHIEISGCHFADAFRYGSGGQGYGVVLEYNTGDCLIQNNTFDHLRHSMLLQAGANGNVLSYNYSINPHWKETSLPDDAAGDLVLHGNYPYLNLFEGNIVQNIVIDDSHGINGPGNTFFRNRAEHYGIFMNDAPSSDGQLFIGNEITSSSLFLGFYALEGTDHFEYGNNVKGNIIPANTTALGEASLYLTTTPAFFEAWELDPGSIGIPNPLKSGNIPAKSMLEEGYFTNCEYQPVVINSTTPSSNSSEWTVYPNPTSHAIRIFAPAKGSLPVSFKLADLGGQILLKGDVLSGTDINLPGLSPGLYILTGTTQTHTFTKMILMQK